MEYKKYLLPKEKHLNKPWRVHELASDFELHDTWVVSLPLGESEEDNFAAFHKMFVENGTKTDSWIVDKLFRLRFFLGRVFGWDTREELTIPGTREGSLLERLTAEDIETAEEVGSIQDFGETDSHLIYRYKNESLMEIANKTIHALIHLGAVEEEDGKAIQVAIYIKSRGTASRFYMGLIKPFRYAFVYPGLFSYLTREWKRAHPTSVPTHS